MKISKIEIKDFSTDSLCSGVCDGVCHIKALPFMSLVQAVEGSYSIKIDDGEEFTTGEGGFFIAPSQSTQTIIHHINKESGIMKARWIFMNIIINDMYKIEHLWHFPVTVPGNTESEYNKMMDSLFQATDICDKMSICYQIVKLLLETGTMRKEAEAGRLSKVLYFMENNYRKNISVAELAELASMSESNFYAVFRKSYGKSPIAYLNDYRLSVASDMLLRTDIPVAAVSESTGFSDPFYFSKLFKVKYHTSPREYRKKKLFHNN